VTGRPLRLALATSIDRNSEAIFAIATSGEIVWLAPNGNAVVVSDLAYKVPLWRAGY
jgi:hypothetical protein